MRSIRSGSVPVALSVALSVAALSALSALAASACGGSDGSGSAGGSPYGSDPNRTVVIGAGTPSASTTPTGDGCVTLPSGECIQPQDYCAEGERADVIVDSKGKLVDVVCYPASTTPTPVDDQGNVELGKENKGVVSIDGANDGVDVGSISSTGNNVTVYGQGPDVSVVGGDVDASGNNFAMRGVTVKGNVEISGNNAALVLCVVEGDVLIHGNNAVIADCSVLGKITIEGNNATLVANEVGGNVVVSDAKNVVCDGNIAWTDANKNKVLDPGEGGAAIACSSK